MNNTEKQFLIDTLIIPIKQDNNIIKINADERNRSRLKEARDLMILIYERSEEKDILENFPIYIKKIIKNISDTKKISWVDIKGKKIFLTVEEIEYILLSAMAFQYKLFINPTIN